MVKLQFCQLDYRYVLEDYELSVLAILIHSVFKYMCSRKFIVSL